MTMNLWLDEASSYFTSQQSFSYIFQSLDFHPPLYFFILKIWISVFGDSIIAMRFLSIIISLFIIGLSIEIFRLFSKDKCSMRFFLANLILNTTFLYHSTQIRQYALGLLFVLIAVYLFLKNNKWFFIPMTLALYTHYFTILAFIPFVFYYRKYWKQFLYSFLLFVPYLPVVISQIRYRLGSVDWFGGITWNTLSANYLNYVAYIDIINSGFILGIVIFLTFAYLVLDVWVVWKNWKVMEFMKFMKFMIVYLMLPVIYIAFCLLVRNIYNPRYFYFLSVFFLIPVFSVKAKYLFILFTVLNLIVAVNYFQEQDYELETVSDYVINNKEAEILVFESPMSMLPVMYYTREHNLTYILIPYQPIEVYSGHLIRHLEKKSVLEIVSEKEIKKINKNSYYFQNLYYLIEGKKVLQLKGINLILSQSYSFPQPSIQ